MERRQPGLGELAPLGRGWDKSFRCCPQGFRGVIAEGHARQLERRLGRVGSAVIDEPLEPPCPDVPGCDRPGTLAPE
jgi:hypothetical protein